MFCQWQVPRKKSPNIKMCQKFYYSKLLTLNTNPGTYAFITTSFALNHLININILMCKKKHSPKLTFISASADMVAKKLPSNISSAASRIT